MTHSDIIFVKTEKLRDLTENMGIDKMEVVYDKPKECYIPYQRKKWGRLDITYYIPTYKLRELSSFIVKSDLLKDEEY